MTDLSAWRAFLGAHARITRELDQELQSTHELGLSDYEVLLRLASADEQGVRMIRLAEQVLLTRSGLTRLVERLEQRGLVERRCCPSDRRGFNVVLTAAGTESLRAAGPTHLEGIERLFNLPLGDDREAVAEALGRLSQGELANCAGPEI